MAETALQALRSFSEKYRQSCLDTHGHLPRSEELVDLVSPCVEASRLITLNGRQMSMRIQRISLMLKTVSN